MSGLENQGAGNKGEKTTVLSDKLPDVVLSDGIGGTSD